MKGKTILIVTIAVLASATSAFIGIRAIATTVTGGRAVATSAEAASGELTTANWLIGAVVGLGGTLVFLVMWIGVSAIALHLAVLAGVTIPD